MKKIAIYAVILSVVLNVYCLLAWLYAYNSYTSYQARIEQFEQFFPSFISIQLINLVIPVLTVLSIILMLLYKAGEVKFYRPAVMSLQILFLCYSIWQFM